MKLYCINLESRKDRWIQIQKDFLPYFTIERFNAIKHKEGWKGCILSHSKVVEKAMQESKEPLYCIMEDDCKPLLEKKLLSSKLDICIQFLKNNISRWDIFFGGGIYIIPTKIIYKFEDGFYMIECSWITCAHFLIHSSKSAKTTIEYGKKEENEWKQGIDNYLASCHRQRIWTTYPMLFEQYCSDTNIGNYTTYLPTIQLEFIKAKEVLRKFVIENDKK